MAKFHVQAVLLLAFVLCGCNPDTRLSFYPMSVAFSPDEATIAAGGTTHQDIYRPGEIHVWDTTNWRQATVLEEGTADTSVVEAIAFSPRTGRLASVNSWVKKTSGRPSERGRLAFYEPPGWTPGPVFSPPFEERIRELVFSPTSGVIALSDMSGHLTFIDEESGEKVPILPETVSLGYSNGGMPRLAFSRDGSSIAVKDSNDTDVSVWSLKDKKCIDTFQVHEEITSLAFSPDSRQLAVSTRDGSILCYDFETRTEKSRLKPTNAYATAVVFTPDGKTLISGDIDGEVNFWDNENGILTHSDKRHFTRVNALSLSPSGKFLAIPSRATEGRSNIWIVNTATKEVLVDLLANSQPGK
jgi:WD40 repeat protein